MNGLRWLAFAIAMTFGVTAAAGALKVGFITALSGPNASMGLPFSMGVKAAAQIKPEVMGHKIKLIVLDDASDPATAARNARKLIDNEQVDVLISGSGVPGILAVAAVARESGTPQIVTAPINLAPVQRGWSFSVSQPAELMIAGVLERMQRSGVRTIGFLGFSDAWGDTVYAELARSAPRAGMTLLSNQRYARTDGSVTGQVLRVMSGHPDAVITGTAGSAGALPYMTLHERGYRGEIYGTHGNVNTDFVRVAGPSVEGLTAPTGPGVVADQLRADDPIRKVAMEFRSTFLRVNGVPVRDAFSSQTYDAWLLIVDAAARVADDATPGTAQFRIALRDALATTRELVGTLGVYNFQPGQVYGFDERARVMVKLEQGQWKLQP